VVFVALLALLSVFVVPTGWWARLAPQGWWLPLVVLVPLAAGDSRRTVRVVALTCLCLLTANSGLKLYSVTELQWRESGARWSTLDAAVGRRAVIARNEENGANSKAFYFTTRQRLIDRDLAFEEVAVPPCAKPLRLESMDLCLLD
jgi:hypothetical protein